MRSALSLLCYALTALRGVEATFQVTYASQSTFQRTSTGARLIPVLVGGPLLTFTPNSVTANPGDVIQFQFAARNHTVTQSAQASPCQPLDRGNGTGGAAAGIHSGFIPFDGGASGFVGTFDVPVRDTNPMFLYCAQATHCQGGMVMVVNAASADLINYAASAAGASSNTPAKQVAGGIVASIPLGNALVPVAPSSPPAATGKPQATTPPTSSPSPPPTTSEESTVTVTHASTYLATATVTRPPSLVGGVATATATTVVVVGPSGVAAASGGGAGGSASGPSRVGGVVAEGGGAGAGGNGTGTGNGTDAAAPTTPPFTFTGAAGPRARGDPAGSLPLLLVSVGVAALGSSLLATSARR